MDIQGIKRDSKAAAAGQWVSDIPEMGDLKLKVRGWSAPEVLELRSRLERALPRAARGRDGKPKAQHALAITGEILHTVILLDWDGLRDGKKAVAYDAALAKKWITDPDYQTFADAVAWSAMAVDRGEFEATEDAKGNS